MEAVLTQSSKQGDAGEARGRPDAASAKDEYRQLCASEPGIPIFSTDWWLDATAGVDGWDVALVRTNGRIIGAMPFHTARRFGMTVVQLPPLTPALGPWIRSNGDKTSTRLGHEQKVMQALIEQLPRFDHFRQTWNKDLSNWLPFYWNGFDQSTEYTYVIPALHDLDAVWNGFDAARRKHCRKGAERHQLRVRDDLSVDDFLVLHRMTLASRGVPQAFTDDCLRRLDAACAQRQRRKIQIVVDEHGRACAGTYTVWDGGCAYALIKGSDPEMGNTGAPSFCQWEAIRFSATMAPRYDFVGNMNPSIEPYVRSFGAEQTPLMTITKTPSRLLRLRQGLKSALGATAPSRFAEPEPRP